MPNLVDVNYEQTGKSKSTNEFGMREMQAKAYEQRDAPYLLLKAPPASGKSRALMFIALDKLRNQDMKKVIVAVPERSIGGSFSSTDLKQFGFFENWEVNEKYNLCTTTDNKSTVESFKEFLESGEEILICTHATLRFAFEQLDESKFNNTLLAIDEFHHVSADTENKLGEVLRNIIEKSSADIIAMTGSYFRGDSVPVLLPEDEAKFTKVTYNYYEQLNGYEYLKSLGIGYHFYQGQYTSAIDEVLDTDKKTILHIPHPNMGESTKDKHKEVDTILDIIGTVESVTEDGILIVKRKTDGKLLKVADLVNDNKKERDKIITYLRNINSVDDMDLIIALGMAKEGFDWPYCEHALTVGYRGSLTEIIQIIGRATRDSENKTSSQFTNLIAQPDANNDEVKLSVNNMLKAITSSLLMEQVLAPSFKFKTRFENDTEPSKKGELKIKGFKNPTSAKVNDIIQSDLDDLKATILQDEQMIKAMPGNIEPEVINEVLIPKIIKVKYPDLNEEEVKELSQYVVVDSVVKNATTKTDGDKQFIRMAGKFINVDDLHIDLINSINPFQKAFEVLSKQVTTGVLKLIQESIEVTRIKMSEEEAVILWPKVNRFVQEHKRHPDINSANQKEKRLAECIIYLKEETRKQRNG
ncbi:MAG: superfamily II DNA or RNA helicase [Sulfurimonas sp.]|jgi:superfamily II DNA or RNA helicase|uniref:DEAD/DEAH box helicase n=1 Tax=Sulfurimonas sp. TaxID=2022749 RepID=UPI0039E3D29D